MKSKRLADAACIGLYSLAFAQLPLGARLASAAESGDKTTTPIKHLLVIIGENRSFDHVFATYAPAGSDTVDNLLSKGIIALDADKRAIPGPHFELAHQLAARDEGSKDLFLLNPPKQEFPRNVLPAPLVGGPKVSYIPNQCATGTPITACQASLALAMQSERGLPTSDYVELLTGGTGETGRTPDARISDVNDLPAGPFQLTNGTTFRYEAYSASPVHRFYQMWQQLNCGVEHASAGNSSGCDGKLFSWVEVTVGAGANGAGPPKGFSMEYAPGAAGTGEGSTALGFYNMQQGDAPYFKSLADKYAMSDNFHQSVDGGTGANHIMFGHGDAIWFSNADGTHVKDTAIFITFDEGGGYYDSGYVQPLDFFGDGTRIPFIVVSPYVKAGHISHVYGDHVSILKFIERNWRLPPVTHRSRDNFPTPVASGDNPYVPLNSPALGDLFDLFDFSRSKSY